MQFALLSLWPSVGYPRLVCVHYLEQALEVILLESKIRTAQKSLPLKYLKKKYFNNLNSLFLRSYLEEKEAYEASLDNYHLQSKDHSLLSNICVSPSDDKIIYPHANHHSIPVITNETISPPRPPYYHHSNRSPRSRLSNASTVPTIQSYGHLYPHDALRYFNTLLDEDIHPVSQFVSGMPHPYLSLAIPFIATSYGGNN
jgi:hypothetical protein